MTQPRLSGYPIDRDLVWQPRRKHTSARPTKTATSGTERPSRRWFVHRKERSDA